MLESQTTLTTLREHVYGLPVRRVSLTGTSVLYRAKAAAREAKKATGLLVLRITDEANMVLMWRR